MDKPKCRRCKQDMRFTGGYNKGKERLDVIYTHEIYQCPPCRTRTVVRN